MPPGRFASIGGKRLEPVTGIEAAHGLTVDNRDLPKINLPSASSGVRKRNYMISIRAPMPFIKLTQKSIVRGHEPTVPFDRQRYVNAVIRRMI